MKVTNKIKDYFNFLKKYIMILRTKRGLEVIKIIKNKQHVIHQFGNVDHF